MHAPFQILVRSRRRGFTLVELLVAVTIFTILATLAVTAMRETDLDRAAAGAQQLRSMLEGARSRAIHDGQLRGVRLLLDANDPQTVTSLVYIGAPRIFRGSITAMNPIDRADPDGMGPRPDPPPRWEVEIDAADSNWQNLRRRRLMVSDDSPVVLRIKIDNVNYHLLVPKETKRGQTPVAEELTYDTSNSENIYTDTTGRLFRLPLAEDVTALPATFPVPYELELLPPILPGSVPKTLANGVAIDLVASQLAPNWRSDAGTTSGTGYWNDDVFSSRMDLLFTPRGDIAGAAASSGLLNFVIADVEDIANDNRYAVADARHPLLQVEKVDRLVTLFTRTGLVTTSQLNHFDSTLNPFVLALLGQDAP